MRSVGHDCDTAEKCDTLGKHVNHPLETGNLCSVQRAAQCTVQYIADEQRSSGVSVSCNSSPQRQARAHEL